jgi:hypothetical protein
LRLRERAVVAVEEEEGLMIVEVVTVEESMKLGEGAEEGSLVGEEEESERE